MNSFLVTEILDLCCYRLPWVESSKMPQLLGVQASGSTNLAIAIRYLCKKGLIESHVVNCADDLAIEPILNSSKTGSSNIDQNATEAALKKLADQNQSVWHPTQFYCCSQISAGLYGCKYSKPTCLLEWAAHRRMANAFLHHVGSSAKDRCKWTSVEVISDQPKFLLAKFESTWLCAPIELNQRMLNRLLLRIRRKGFRYEVW